LTSSELKAQAQGLEQRRQLLKDILINNESSNEPSAQNAEIPVEPIKRQQLKDFFSDAAQEQASEESQLMDKRNKLKEFLANSPATASEKGLT
jgi:hypothetical protein